MKPSKNLRDRLAHQSGLPTGTPGAAAGIDGGLAHQIQLEKAKRQAAAAGEPETHHADRHKSITAGKAPSEQRHGPKGGPGSGRGASKSTTQQGLR